MHGRKSGPAMAGTAGPPTTASICCTISDIQTMQNLKFVPLAILELLAFNAQTWGHVTLATPFLKKISGIMSGLSLGTCMSNLKSVASAFLELLAFKTPKFKVSRDPGHAHFQEKISEVMSGLSLGAYACQI